MSAIPRENVRLARTPLLPAGYTARPVKMDDLEAMVDLFNAHSRALVGVDQNNIKHVRMEWEAPILHLERDTMAVFKAGKPVGYIEFWDNGEPHVKLMGWAAVHPEHWGRGLGSFLLDWLFGRAVQSLPLAEEGARVVLQQFAVDQDRRAAELLMQRGFERIRSSYHMQIDFAGPVEVPALPDGITIRSVQNDEEERAAMIASFEAFKDHWGHVDEPVEAYYQRRKYLIDHDPDYDRSLWFIALDGDQVVGVSLCRDHSDEDDARGWVDTLGVVRDWRKRGLGMALLRHSFREFQRRGKQRAGLGVDASSLTGAVRLYERAGMRVWRKYNLFELELRPGQDLTTTGVE